MKKFYNDVVIVQLLNNMEKQEIKIAPKVKTWEERLDSARKQIEVEKCL